MIEALVTKLVSKTGMKSVIDVDTVSPTPAGPKCSLEVGKWLADDTPEVYHHPYF